MNPKWRNPPDLLQAEMKVGPFNLTHPVYCTEYCSCHKSPVCIMVDYKFYCRRRSMGLSRLASDKLRPRRYSCINRNTSFHWKMLNNVRGNGLYYRIYVDDINHADNSFAFHGPTSWKHCHMLRVTTFNQQRLQTGTVYIPVTKS